MFSLRTLTLSALALAGGASARVTGMTAPATAVAGSNITATLEVESYIQNWNDFGVIWGLEPTGRNCSDCAGQLISYNNLYNEPGVPTTHGNASFSVPITSYTDAGNYLLVAAVPYLVGASGGTGIRYFNSNITITSS